MKQDQAQALWVLSRHSASWDLSSAPRQLLSILSLVLHEAGSLFVTVPRVSPAFVQVEGGINVD